ncbi:MAG: glycosyltransferase family 4 protein [Bacteroidota bacterium]
MRVLEVCTSPSLGGLELYFISCCNHLHDAKEVEIWAYVKNESLIHKNLKNSINTGVEKSNNLFQRVKSLLAVISHFQPQIVHSHNKTDLLPIALAKVFSRRSFKHVHTRQMNLPGRKKNPFHYFLYKQVDSLIAITERLKNQILKNTTINPEKVRVLYYGVPEAGSDFVKLDETKNNANFKVGLFARIDAKKNQHVLLEALSLLKNKGIDVSAYLIGRPTDELYTQKLENMIAQLDLHQQVKMMGFVQNPINKMRNFDVILLTSADETFGLVLAEAMRAGVAVIGADGGGVPEIIEHEKSGLLFEPNNPESLAGELEKLIINKDLVDQLAINGKKIADEKFNEEKHFKSLRQILKDVSNT